MKSIHQFVENVVPGDAISNDCIQIYHYLNELGYKSNIYSRATFVNKSYIHKYLEPISPDDGIIFHHSTFSPLLDYVRNLPNKKVLIYHNITPPAFFKDYNYKLYKIFKEANRQNYLLENSSFQALVGDSKYNLSQIKKYVSAEHEEVFPPFLSLQFKGSQPNDIRPVNSDTFTMMFVGRFAPNKKQLDIIKIFEYYSKFINPQARLILVGHYAYTDLYFSQILSYIRNRNIKNVIIKGSVTSHELAEDYKQTDVFLSMSEHEGFCIPVLESIYFNVPVLAYKIPALEELLDKKYLIPHKNYMKIGHMLYTIQKNKNLKKQMVLEQRKILNTFEESKIKSKFKAFINQIFI